MKKILSMFLILNILFSCSISVFAESKPEVKIYSDVEGHWAHSSIKKWENSNILVWPEIKKNDKLMFLPDKAVTRAEFLSLIVGLLALPKADDIVIKDSKETMWYNKYLQSAINGKIITGYTDQTVKPDNLLTRQEAALILCNAFGFKTFDRDILNKYKDIDKIGEWAKDAVAAISYQGYMGGRSGGMFDPAKNMTRAEIVKILDVISSGNYNSSQRKWEFGQGIIHNAPDGVIRGSLVLTGQCDIGGLTIDGNLFIAQGAYGNIKLEDVEVIGNIYLLSYSGVINLNGVKAENIFISGIDNGRKLLLAGESIFKNIYVYESLGIENSSYSQNSGILHIEKNMDPQKLFLSGSFEKIILADETPVIDISGINSTKIYKNAYNYHQMINIIRNGYTPVIVDNKELAHVYRFCSETVEKLVYSGMNQFEKELAVHDFIVKTYYYDPIKINKIEYAPESYTAYGLITTGKGVCSAYAELAQIMLELCGIETVFMNGSSYSVEDNAQVLHNWLIVKIEGKYYHLDPTWDDPVPDKKGESRYYYFNLNDSIMSSTHIWDKSLYPKCESMEMNYFSYNNKILKSYNDIKNYIITGYKNGIKKFDIMINEYDPKKHNIEYVKPLFQSISDEIQKSISYEFPNSLRWISISIQ